MVECDESVGQTSATGTTGGACGWGSVGSGVGHSGADASWVGLA